MIIRAYKQKDHEKVRDICLATSTIEGMDREMLALLYADYYTEIEPQNVFILADDKDEAVGYILSAENYKNFIRVYKEKYLDRVKALSKKSAFEMKNDFMLMRLVGKIYPGHLHIDILPEVQRGGWGHKLMDILLTHLKEKGVKGVHLGVGAGNEKGVNFYKKYGFKKILNIFGKAYVFGIKLK